MKTDKRRHTIMNQHIRTIAILGAGAVGSYLVMGLSDKYKENLWVIADGERKVA